jgi:fimbrial chaperone protein
MHPLRQVIHAACAWGWLAACALVPCAVQAQVLISPVVVELGARQRAVAITVSLSSKATAPVMLQSEVLQWEQGLDGAARHQGSTDLVVAPPIAEIKPGESQVFRVALSGPRRHPGELAYRLILEDVSQAPPDNPAAGLSFKLRYDLPVLVAPAEPLRAAPRWLACAAKPGEACVRLSNGGNKRITLQSLAVEGAGWSRPVAAPGSVLAGADREWRVLLAPGQAGAAIGVAGTLRSGEPVQATLSSP